MAKMFRQTKLDYEGINNALLKNIEVLDNENTQLKTALTELQTDLKEKENSIEESHKIIKKLKDEYSKLIKEYENIENYNNELILENDNKNKTLENILKSNNNFEKIKNKLENVLIENDKIKKENFSLKNNLINNQNISNKKEQEFQTKELIINDLKERTDNWLMIIKERENIINEQNKKIRELNDIISQKDDQLKVMVNFSKEINKENKTNITEITKQAVKTIKIFYNSLNNKNNDNLDNAYRIEFKNSNTTFSDFENYFINNNNKNNKNKISFYLEDALNGMMYIPLELKSVSKEFLMDMNFKTELLKSEYFSSLIRETNFVYFLEEIFQKLNFKDTESLKNLCSKIITLKTNNDLLIKENIDLKNKIYFLIENKKEFDLYSQKLKDDIKNKLNKIKEKFNLIDNNLDGKVKNFNNTNKYIKDKYKKDIDKLKAEIIVLKTENNKLTKDLEYYKNFKDFNANDNNRNLLKNIENPNFNLDNYNNNNSSINSARFNNNNKNWNQFIFPINEESFNIFSYNINSFNNLNNNNKLINNNNNNNNSIYKNSSVINKNNNNEYNENNYMKKKKEIKNLKEEIGRIKNEMNTIMKNPNSFNNNTNSSNLFYSSTNNNNNNNTIPNSNSIENNNTINELIQKNKSLSNELLSLKQYLSELENNNNKFSPDLFIKMFYNINSKLFSSSELKKYYSIYNSNSIPGIIDIFNHNIDVIKRNINESHFDIDTSYYTDIDENLINTKNSNLNSSYRLVNERIIKLKKFEFDFLNFCEILKNFLVAEEIIIKLIFNSNNDIIQFEPLEQLFKLFEDALNYRIDDMNDDVIFIRKLMIRFIKNQKNCLGLSLEYASNNN